MEARHGFRPVRGRGAPIDKYRLKGPHLNMASGNWWHLAKAGLGRIFGLGTRGSRPRAALDDPPRPYAAAEIVACFVAQDGKRRVEVVRRHDGFFSFAEEQELEDEYIGVYWSPLRGSGLYETGSEALRDAHSEIPWLRPSLT